MRQAWQSMLDQYAKNQQQQILNAKNLPEWVKARMLKQHEQQISMMNSNPPMVIPNNQRAIAAPQMQRTFNQPAPGVNQHFMRPQMQPGMRPNVQPVQNYPPQQMPAPANRMQSSMMQQGHPFMRPSYPVAPYNNYRR